MAVKSNYGSQRALGNIKYIVIHYTANDGDTDEGNGNYFANNTVYKSAHYFVDGDSITQTVPDNYIAFSVGGNKYADCNKTGGGKHYGQCTNANSISIELCDEVKNGQYDFSKATIENAVEYVKILMKKYNIDIKHVIRHFDVTGKPCPAPYVDNSKWQEFKNMITESGELTVSQYEELKKQIAELKNVVESLEKSTQKVYNCIEEIPEWGRTTIQKLIDKGLLKGVSENDLGLTENLLRTLVINDRAGLYE